MSVRIINADVFAGLAKLPDESVHCVVTSPPYWGLRDYGTATWEGGDIACDHRKVVDPVAAVATSTLGGGKKSTGHLQEGFKERCARCGARRIDAQIGLEPTLQEHIAKLVEVFREVRRVLRKDGTVWCNYGDAFASHDPGGYGLKPKDLLMMPARLAIALQQDGWWLRSDIIWRKENPMPESVTDRPTKSHEHIFLLTKSPRYFFDAEAIKEPAESDHPSGNGFKREARRSYLNADGSPRGNDQQWADVGGARNCRDVWSIATEPFPGSHFATMPTEIVRRCILAGTSEKGCCAECGAPWVREMKAGYQGDDRPQMRRARELFAKHNLTDAHLAAIRAVGITDAGKAQVTTDGYGKNDPEMQRLADEAKAVLKGYYREFLISRPVMAGWRPSCTCNADVVPCTVLDPFGGSGTTGVVADRLGRDAILIELNPEYAAMAERRIARDRLERGEGSMADVAAAKLEPTPLEALLAEGLAP